MAESTVPKVIKDGIITIYDATSVTRLEYEMSCEDGTFSIDPGTPEAIEIYDRDEVCGSRLGKEPIGTVSWSVHMREFTNSTSGSLLDFIEATGAIYGAGGTTPIVATGDGRFEGFIRGVQYDAAGVVHGDAFDHRLYADVVRLTWSFSEGNPDIINISGMLYSAVVREETTL